MKICSACRSEKPLSEFGFKNRVKGIPASKCKECAKDYARKHYAINAEALREGVTSRRRQIGKWWREYKATQKCSRCAECHPATLDWHHTDGSDKTYGISDMVYVGFSIEAIQREIEKCIVLCANCHRKEHYDLHEKSRRSRGIIRD